MTDNLFGTVSPSLADAADGATNYALGTRFTPGVNGTATHMRWRFPNTTPSASAEVQCGIYRVSDQVLLASTTFPLVTTPGDWRTVALPSPPSLVAATEYVAVIWTPLRYVATATYGWPFTSGNLVASSNNGYLAVNPGALTYPSTLSGNTASYFADLLFEPAGASTDIDGTRPTAVTLAAAATVTRPADGTRPTTVTLAGAATVARNAAGDRAITAAGAGAASGTFGAAGNLAISATVTGAMQPAAPVVTTGPGWSSLYGILSGWRADQEEYLERRRNPVECPVHKYPLDQNAEGVLHCTFGGHIVTRG